MRVTSCFSVGQHSTVGDVGIRERLGYLSAMNDYKKLKFEKEQE